MFDFLKERQSRKALRAVNDFLAIRIRDVMTDYVVTTTPEKSVVEVATRMIGDNISTLVVEKENKPIGIVTEHDFILKVTPSKAAKLKVHDMMTPMVWSVTPDTTIEEAVALLKQHHIRKLVVLNQEGTIAGIVTQTDLSRVLQDNIRVITSAVPPLFVRDVMTEPLVSVAINAAFEAARKVMVKHNVAALPLTQKDDYVGIFTEYDVVMEFASTGGKLVKKVSELSKTPIRTIPAGLTIFDANTIMLYQNSRRLLVVEDSRVVGIVTQTDIIHAGFAYLEELRTYLHERPLIAAQHGFITLPDKKRVVSEFVGPHLRSYTIKPI